MEPIKPAVDDAGAFHERNAHTPAAEGAAQGSPSFPPGIDPVAYALLEVARLRETVERTCMARRPDQPAQWAPKVNIYAGEEKSRILLEMPGVGRDGLSVTLNGNELVVRGEREPPAPHGAMEPIVVEQSWGAFERRFQVPSWCTPECISARCADGMLEIDVGPRRGNTPAEIQIEIG